MGEEVDEGGTEEEFAGGLTGGGVVISVCVCVCVCVVCVLLISIIMQIFHQLNLMHPLHSSGYSLQPPTQYKLYSDT